MERLRHATRAGLVKSRNQPRSQACIYEPLEAALTADSLHIGETAAAVTRSTLPDGALQLDVRLPLPSALPPAASPRVEIIDVAPSEQDVPIAPLPGTLLEVVRDEIGEWSLRRGETLRDALTRWSEAAGYTLVWQADVDFAIEADLGYPRGTKFRDAIRRTMQAFWRTPTPLVAHLYSNNVLVIAGRAPS